MIKFKQLENKLDQKDQALKYFKEKSIKLEKSLENTKIFLNMVIHDLRNPTNQVEYLVNQSLQKLKQIQQKYKKIRQEQSNISHNSLSLRSKQSEFHLKKRKDPIRGNSFSAKNVEKILVESEKIEVIHEGNAEQIESGDYRP